MVVVGCQDEERFRPMDEKVEQVLKPEEIAAELGPFTVPESISFEPEFEPAAPQPIPRQLRQGAYETKLSQVTYVAFMVGLVCVGFSLFGFMKELGYYILPIGYLSWIGYGIMALAAIARMMHYLRLGRYEYVCMGLPLVARVLQTGKQLGPYETNELKFLSLIEYKHPETNQTAYETVASPQIATTFKPEAYTTTLEAGDYVTAVYLPGKLEESLQIYGYLGLNPEVDFIRKNGKRIKEHVSLAKTLGIAALIVGVFALLIAVVYTIEFRVPIEVNPWHFAAAVAGGSLLVAILSLAVSLSKRRDDKKTLRALLKVFGAGAIGGVFLTLILVMLVNSVFDRSEPEYRDIKVVNFWQETWSFLIRNYDIEYRELAGGRTDRYPATLSHMERFGNPRAGVIEVHQGFLGWPWVSHIHPVVLVRIVPEGDKGSDSPEPNEPAGRQPDEADDVDKPSFVPAVLTDSGELMPVSEKLSELVLRNIRQRGPREETPSYDSGTTSPDAGPTNTQKSD
jgi:hypothetical protein